jgi:hypothetical protein
MVSPSSQARECWSFLTSFRFDHEAFGSQGARYGLPSAAVGGLSKSRKRVLNKYAKRASFMCLSYSVEAFTGLQAAVLIMGDGGSYLQSNNAPSSSMLYSG